MFTVTLTNRTKTGAAIDNNLLNALKELSKETRIPQSRLLDEAIELLLEKHGKPVTEIVIEPIVEPITEPVIEDEPDRLDEVIEMLDLPPVIFNKLNRSWSKIKTVRDLLDADISKIRGIGPKHRKVIVETLDKYVKSNL